MIQCLKLITLTDTLDILSHSFGKMESLISPKSKFKSKVEQFYYDHMTASQIDLVHQEVLSESDALKVHEARKRAYSGDGRKSYFTFDHEDVRKHQNMRKTRTNDYELKYFSF